MKTVLFGGHHQTEQARKKRRNTQHTKQYGAYQSYGSATASNSSGLYPVNRSKTFPSYFDNQPSASAFTQPGRLITDLDSFSRSPEQSPISSATQMSPHLSPLKRKAEAFESTQAEGSAEINPEHAELKTWATKPKKRLTLDPQKKAEVQAHNKRIQDARQKCQELGIKYED